MKMTSFSAVMIVINLCRDTTEEDGQVNDMQDTHTHTHTHTQKYTPHSDFRDVTEGKLLSQVLFFVCVCVCVCMISISISHTCTYHTGHTDLFKQRLKLQFPAFTLKRLQCVCVCVCVSAAIVLHRKLVKRLIHHLWSKICN